MYDLPREDFVLDNSPVLWGQPKMILPVASQGHRCDAINILVYQDIRES